MRKLGNVRMVGVNDGGSSTRYGEVDVCSGLKGAGGTRREPFRFGMTRLWICVATRVGPKANGASAGPSWPRCSRAAAGSGLDDRGASLRSTGTLRRLRPRASNNLSMVDQS